MNMLPRCLRPAFGLLLSIGALIACTQAQVALLDGLVPASRLSIQKSFSDLASGAAADPADAVCARSAVSSVAADPPVLSSQNGKLEVTFQYQTAVDDAGLTRYCYVYTDSSGSIQEAPTLEVNPGDQLIIHFTNNLPVASAAAVHTMHSMKMQPGASAADAACSATSVSSTSTNIHFHGTNVAPVCHQDEVVHTLIQPQEEFDYDVQIPANEPPGVYWYHPHPHGYSDAQVLGGATGAIIVKGIQNVNPVVAGLPQRVFVLRDQSLPASDTAQPGNPVPKTDLSINYVPILYPSYVPAVIQTGASEQEFWRVLNSAADTILNLAVMDNGQPQPIQIVSVDGVPLTDSSGDPTTTTVTSYTLAPASRVEFIVTTPAVGDTTAQLVTQTWDNGPNGDADPGRPIANIVSSASASSSAERRLPAEIRAKAVTRFAGLQTATPVTKRTLYFSVNLALSPAQFYITQQGQTPAVFNMDGPPNIVVTEGTVEEWTIQNQSEMDHAFHIHQLHFQTLAINGVAVNDTTLRDTINVPHWTGTGPYPSVTLMMDFRDPNIVGTFVYHCHVLSHEDRGMMGMIQVLPGATTTTLTTSPEKTVAAGTSVTLTATVAPAAGSGTPTGTVTFKDGSTTLGTGSLNKSGVATLATTALPIGNNTITAVYSGDNSFAGSTAKGVAIAVTAAQTTTSLAVLPTTLVFGGSAALTATVTALTGDATPSGTVTFQNGGVAIGSAALNASGVATLSTTSLPVGSLAITAAFGGSADFAASTSPPFTVTVQPAGTATALQFIPVTPCRVADTRNPAGPFGGPALNAGETREFLIPQSACSIPTTAVAYSLNVTVVPNGELDYLSLWPTGESQPVVSTLNSLDGRIKANAAVTPAGTNGGVYVYVTDATNVILDIDGYFVPAGTASALAFYPVTPCRIADTRQAAGPLGGPSLPAATSRAFPILSSSCNLPSTAKAYSLNVTAVPNTTLDYLTSWPTGQAQPNVSTLNATTGTIVANAAIVPAGASGEVSIYVSDAANVILDVNGYFAPLTTGGLSLYTVTPCRALDSRPNSFSGSTTAKVQSSTCAPPSTARAYVLNATVVPTGVLDYLTLWPNGSAQPNVSTLNALDGSITSNMAIVPNSNGTIDAFTEGSTNLILDISSYFAP